MLYMIVFINLQFKFCNIFIVLTDSQLFYFAENAFNCMFVNTAFKSLGLTNKKKAYPVKT